MPPENQMQHRLHLHTLRFVIRHSSFVIRHSSFVIRHSSFVIRHLLRFAHPFGAAYGWLSRFARLSFVILLTAYCLLLTAYCLLLTAYCLLLTLPCFSAVALTPSPFLAGPWSWEL